MNRLGEELMRHLAGTLSDAEWAAMFSPEGLARHTTWRARDGWLVSYTTSRIRHGTLDGKFAVMLYRPVGKGARTGNASTYKRVYLRAFSTRKAARARAEQLYWKHSPKREAAR